MPWQTHVAYTLPKASWLLPQPEQEPYMLMVPFRWMMTAGRPSLHTC